MITSCCEGADELLAVRRRGEGLFWILADLYNNIVRNVVPALQGQPNPSGFNGAGVPAAVQALKPSPKQPGFYHPILNLPGCANSAINTLSGR